MPKNAKGKKIMKAMKEHYGEKKGEGIFYKMKSEGKIANVDKGGKTKQAKRRNTRRNKK